MTTLKDLGKPSISGMNTADALSLVLQVRRRRQTPNPASKKRGAKIKKEKGSLATMIDKMTPEQAAEVLRRIGGDKG